MMYFLTEAFEKGSPSKSFKKYLCATKRFIPEQDLADRPEYQLLLKKDSASVGYFSSEINNDDTDMLVIWERTGTGLTSFSPL